MALYQEMKWCNDMAGVGSGKWRKGIQESTWWIWRRA